MELGNMCFGNSRGAFPVPRDAGFEEELNRLFNAYAPKRDNSWREYGEEFENDTFSVFPYYWGECTCGFEEKDFTEKHRPECYQSELREEKLKHGWTESNAWLEAPKDMSYQMSQTIEDKIYKNLCKKFKLSYPGGCAVHCTCDLDERYEKWLKEIDYPDGHKSECLLVKPNFLYKPTDFQIQWYKYPLRDSYSNQEITLADFRKIIDQCITSINK